MDLRKFADELTALIESEEEQSYQIRSLRAELEAAHSRIAELEQARLQLWQELTLLKANNAS